MEKVHSRHIAFLVREKALGFTIILFLTAGLLNLPATYSSTEYVYTTASFRVSTGSVVLYGTVRVSSPKYIYVDREYTMMIEFERSACVTSGLSIVVVVAGTVNIGGSTQDIDLGQKSFSFYCEYPNQQKKNFDFVIPNIIYENSIDKILTIRVKKVEISYGSASITMTSNTPGKAYIVKEVPKTTASIIGLENGLVNMSVGDRRLISINVSALYAPIVIENISLRVPEFVSIYINTPLPLNIGVNESELVEITVNGDKPGAGIITVTIYYYDGFETRRLFAFIPVIVEERRIYKLIELYNNTLYDIKSKIKQLEKELEINVSALMSLDQKLNKTITLLNETLQEINKLTKNVNKTINDTLQLVNSLSNKIALVETNLDELSYTVGKIQTMLEIFNNTLNNIEYILDIHERKINSIMNKTNSLEHNMSDLYIMTSNIKSEIVVLQQDLSDLKSGLLNLNNSINVLREQINNIIVSVDLLTHRYNTLEESSNQSINILEYRINSLNTELNKIRSNIDTNIEQIDSLLETVNVLEDRIKSLQNKTNKLQYNILSLTYKQKSLDNKLDNVEDRLNWLDRKTIYLTMVSILNLLIASILFALLYKVKKRIYTGVFG